MTANTGKALSIGLVGAMVGYCCWAYVFGLDQGPVAQQKIDEPNGIAASMLLPSIAPAPDRNPFHLASRAQDVGEVATTLAHNDANAESESDTETETEHDSNPDAAESAGALALKATFIHGDQRSALINGRVYAQGELLADPESLTSSFVVSEIFADRVVIERNGQSTELSYSDPDSASPSSARTPADTPATRPRAATKRQLINHRSSPTKRASNCPTPKGPQQP